MSIARHGWCGAALLSLACLVPLTAAQTAKLQTAKELFARQDYTAAQAALLEVDRTALTADEQQELDELLRVVPKAITGAERAHQDAAAGDEAFEAGQWEMAQIYYEAILDNEFATDALQTQARTQLDRIQEKRDFAEAAHDATPVEQTLPEPETPAAEPQPASEPTPAAQPAPVAPEMPRRATPADELRFKDELLWQRAVAKAQANAEQARAAATAKDFDTARRYADTAVQTIEAARQFAEPVTKYQTLHQQMLDLKTEIVNAQNAYQATQARDEQDQIKKRVIERARLIEEHKREKIAQLFNVADSLRRERRFGEAADVLREILRIDPANARAQDQLTVAEDYESFLTQQIWRDTVYNQQRDALAKAEETLIPWDVDVLYPKNWVELTNRRKGLDVVGGTGDGEDAQLNEKLTERLPQAEFEQQPFDQVVEFLGQITQTNISVDWTNLEDMGIDRDKPVTIRLNQLSFRTVLEEILAQVGGDVQLAYAVGDGLIRIATKEKLDRDKLILIYDIRDLLINIPRADRNAAFDVTQGMGEGGSGGGGGSSGMFGENNQNDNNNDNQNQNGIGNEELIQRIMDIIRQTVEPDSWRETGGGNASIQELNGQLIVYNTSDAHRQVQNLLKQLRETRALQISVETRFLNVTSNFLEQFGVDLDFVFNSGSAGYDRAIAADGSAITDPFTGAPVLVDRRYSRIGSYAAVPTVGSPLTPGAVPLQPYNQAAFVPQSGGIFPQVSDMTPITAQQGSFSLVDPTGRSTGVPGSFGTSSALTPALNIAGSFLDNLQVDFLIRATQANARSSIVQAPRLVLFNGQASSISVGRSRSYVATLTPQLAEGAVGFEPEVETADSGVSMWVEGTISADRKYVTLTLDVRQRDEPTFERFQVQQASGSSPGAFILLPDYSFAVMQTTVSVPDGGTVLLGGLKQVGEVEVEAGVPVLSKIPILKRAFSNTSTVKDVRTLLILVKTKIIIQNEAESEAFPQFSSSAGY